MKNLIMNYILTLMLILLYQLVFNTILLSLKWYIQISFPKILCKLTVIEYLNFKQEKI
jgi:hypothetical protein